jgi:hypothetical protein
MPDPQASWIKKKLFFDSKIFNHSPENDLIVLTLPFNSYNLLEFYEISNRGATGLVGSEFEVPDIQFSIWLNSYLLPAERSVGKRSPIKEQITQ